MKDYLQPDFYHFSSDSIELAKLVIERHREEAIQGLCDAFAGCGVIAQEVGRTLSPSHIIYNELQEEFVPFIEKNHQEFLSHISYQIVCRPFTDLIIDKRVEILVANPPYFNAGEGRASQNKNRYYCRHFVQDNFDDFMDKLFELKKDISYIYFVTRVEINREGVIKLKDLGKGNSIYQLA
ncbi:MAG: hypothetical protein CME62_11115 [Halobacteriovoraceae bacterium]|nr:hypothetical protein [Halobacteriovoraceae bacterium]|tara:strand:- start:12203 stop:12745 length:543 start_codon:yes stop_codon:yes gene_type:complete